MTGLKTLRLPFGSRVGPGMLITVDGLDGAGKTTIVDRIRAHLENDGVTVLGTRLPTTEMRQSRSFRLMRDRGRVDLIDPMAFEVEYMADRIQHCATVIGPALREGTTVVTDRYALSSIGTLLLRLPELRSAVFRAFFDDDWFRDLCKYLIKPDLSFVLYADAAAATSRLRSREGEADVDFEPADYEELQQVMLSVARANAMISISNSGSVADALADCAIHLDRLRFSAAGAIGSRDG